MLVVCDIEVHFQTMNPFRSACLLLPLLVIAPDPAHAQNPQKEIEHRHQIWLGYFIQTRLSDRWGLWGDIHYRRTENFVRQPFQFVIRPAVSYFIADNLRISVGYAYAHHFPPKGLNTARKEHRPWQQIWWNQKHPGFTTSQSLRLEQRFNERIVDDVKEQGYNYNFRARYNLSFLLPLKGKEMAPKTPFAAVMNEVFLNFGDKVVYNTFDQNRFFAGFGYQFSPHLNAQLGYMNTYQQQASGTRYFSTHTVRLFVFHALDMRKEY